MQAENAHIENAPIETASAGCDRLVHFYETINPSTLHEIANVYHPQAHFKDPFNSVNGTDAIQGIFSHMFRTVREPRFHITQRVQQGNEAFLVWNFSFERGVSDSKTLTIHGVSHIRFHDDGRVITHRDYWDPAEELYEKLPLLGGLMRWIKTRLKA